jgi:hypothetical protein
LFASVTFTVTENGLPATAVGVPEIVPELLPMVSPGGRFGEVHVYGGVPPLAVRVVEEYPTPTVPAGSEAGVAEIDNGGAIARVYVKVAVALTASTTVTVMVFELAALDEGVPLRTPVAGVKVSPVPVNPLADRVYGPPPPPDAVKVTLW